MSTDYPLAFGDLISSIAEFIHKTYGNSFDFSDGKNNIRFERVAEPGVCINSREEQLQSASKLIDGMDSPQRFQSGMTNLKFGDKAYLQFGKLTDKLPVIIRGVHFLNNKCKFDLALFVLKNDGWHETRIYNIDADYVHTEGGDDVVKMEARHIIVRLLAEVTKRFNESSINEIAKKGARDFKSYRDAEDKFFDSLRQIDINYLITGNKS